LHDRKLPDVQERCTFCPKYECKLPVKDCYLARGEKKIKRLVDDLDIDEPSRKEIVDAYMEALRKGIWFGN